MKPTYLNLIPFMVFLYLSSCNFAQKTEEITAAEILGNPEYMAMSYGGYRELTRDIQPTIPQLKEDMRILAAMGIKIIRTYNVHYDEAANLLEAIRQMRKEDPGFEMYVMLGAWIDCKNAWTELPDRIRDQDSERNAAEISRAAELASQYPEIVKIIAVGNEAMVHWASSYYVEPGIILKWVNHLQNLKNEGALPETLWITSSDNFAAWGGGGAEYHKEDLNELIRSVDFISMHTYPMHDTHYNPDFWAVPETESDLTDLEKIESAMLRARDHAVAQYNSVVNYMRSLGVDKPVHIGETGWASISNEQYGPEGSRAVDEYKAALYYWHIRDWSQMEGVSCFYFEAFDEPWKDEGNPLGSENHFGLINIQGQAKFALWNEVDDGKFKALRRDGKPITKTFDGEIEALMQTVKVPPAQNELISSVN
ncbi:MAG: glycosyl hydrolase family 17 [Cyclobacteriaceae bacterium]|nr:glycosyl hydrolase family 17 [Cyclobacteriaceae bacterium]